MQRPSLAVVVQSPISVGRSKWEVVGRRLEEFIRADDRAAVVEVRGTSLANHTFTWFPPCVVMVSEPGRVPVAGCPTGG